MKKHSWKDLFAVIPLPCIVARPAQNGSYTILDANQAYLELTHTTPADLIGKSSDEAFPKNPQEQDYGHDQLIRSLDEVLATGKRNRINILRYDIPLRGTDNFVEKYWQTENIPLLDNEGKTEYILHCIQDISRQVLSEKKEKKIKETLEFNQQQFRNFIQGNPDGLYRLDLQGKFIHANDGLAAMAECSMSDLVNRDFAVFCTPQHQHRVWNQFKKAARGISNTFEAEFISAKGNLKILKIILMPMRIDEEIVEVHGIAKDVTELRKTEKVMVERSRFLEVNAAFITSLLENDLNPEVLQDAFGIIGNTVEVDRMYYFSAHTNAAGELLISQKIEWTSSRAVPQIDNPEMQDMCALKLEEIMAPLKKNLPFMATLSDLPVGKMKEIFLDQGIKAMLLLPLILDNKLHGFIGFDDCSKERLWTDDEIIFLQSLAHNFSSALEKRSAKKEMKLHEEQLRQSEKKFKALVQEGSDLIAILDEEGNYKFVSETSTSILGYSPSEMVGKSCFEYINPQDHELVQKELSKLQTQKQIKAPFFRFRHNDGSWRWIQTTATNLLNDPDVNGIIANSRDITTLVNQAKEIESINERYQLAATATQDLIYDWDLEKETVTRFHRGEKELFGYPSEIVNQKDFWNKKIHPDDLEIESEKLARTLANPEQNFIKTEYRFRKADDTYAMVIDKGYIIRNESGKAVRLIGATSDVSEITAKEEALKIANRRFKIAMKATNEMIWDWEIASDSVTRSKGYKSIFGYDTTEATSVHSFWMTKVAEEDRLQVRESLKRAIEDRRRKKWMLEYRIIKADGEVAYVHDRGYIIRNEKGEATRMVGAVLDVTESRRLIRKTQEQNKILKEIAWEQSHVVRAPLCRIKGLFHLLEQENFVEMSSEEVLFHIKASIEELDEIIRSIVSKTEKIDVESV